MSQRTNQMATPTLQLHRDDQEAPAPEREEQVVPNEDADNWALIVGNVVLECRDIEATLALALRRLLPATGFQWDSCIANLPLEQKLVLLTPLVEQRWSKLRTGRGQTSTVEEFAELAQECRESAAFRDGLVHSPEWSHDHAPGDPVALWYRAAVVAALEHGDGPFEYQDDPEIKLAAARVTACLESVRNFFHALLKGK